MTRPGFPRVEFWRTGDRWYFHVKHGNYRVTSPSQGYTRRWSCRLRARVEHPRLRQVQILKDGDE